MTEPENRPAHPRPSHPSSDAATSADSTTARVRRPRHAREMGDEHDGDVDSHAPVPEATGGSSFGQLTDQSRRALVALLQGPFIDGRRDPSRYSQILRDRSRIEARLADLFLELVIDDDARIAFVRQAEDEPDAPKLLRKLSTLNRLDSVLLLVLRQLLLTQSSRGQRAVVSERELQQALAAYRRSDSTDEAGFARDVRASISKLSRAGLLEEQGDSFEISPVLRLLIDPDTAREFIAAYERSGDGPVENDDPAASEEPDGDATGEDEVAEGETEQ